jgi:hypothetical protein
MRGRVLIFGVATTVLLAGVAVYAIGRAPGSGGVVPFAGYFWQSGQRSFTPFFGSFPSFAHAFAFSVFMALVLPWRPAWIAASCALWAVIDVAFEIGQHPAVVAKLPAWMHQVTGFDRLRQYLTSGTFDLLDVVAAVLGAIAAYGLLSRAGRFESRTLEA